MDNCNHEILKEINVVVIAGVLSRKMVFCEDCGSVLEDYEYEVDDVF